MRQSVHMITVGVTDLAASTAFYRDGLGWQPLKELDEIVFYEVGAGIVFATMGNLELAADMGAPIGVESAFTLGHVVDGQEQVDAVLEQAREAGARILKEPQEAMFGGYHAYFADPDGHRWEISHGRGLSIGTDGRVALRLDQPI